MPTWPVGFPDFPQPVWNPGFPSGPVEQQKRLSNFDLRAIALESFAKEMSNIIKPEPDEWIRPQPKCIRQVDPYEF